LAQAIFAQGPRLITESFGFRGLVDMPRDVWVATSNVANSFGSSGVQSQGKDRATVVAQHWIVVVGDYSYQAGNSGGLNTARKAGAAKDMCYNMLSGNTSKTDSDIDAFVREWNKNPGGYNLLTNSCQTFVHHLVRFLCDGQGKLPEAGGFQARAGASNVEAHVGVGEVFNVSGDVAKVAAAGPAAGVNLSTLGAHSQLELCRVEGGVDTGLGRVGARFCPNLNTGAGIRNGNLECTFLGEGFSIGKDGVGVRTAAGAVDCSVM